MQALIRHYADYDLWANTRFVERLAAETDELLDRPAPGSFPSLRATLLHIRDAEHTWWGRLTGTATRWPAEEDRSIDGLRKHGAILRDHVHVLTSDDLARERTYHDLRGNAHTQPAWHMIMHCFNHSTQHRGQVITQMRALGLDAIPANDMVVFQRTLARRD